MKSFLFGVFCLLPLGLLLGACTKTGFVAETGVFDSASESLDNGGSGAVALQFTSPSSSDLTPEVFKVSLTAEPLNQLKELKLFVNGKEHTRFVKVPFETNVDPNKVTDCEITLKAQATDRAGQLSFRTLRVRKTADCIPTQDPGTDVPPSSKNAGIFDSNCMNNNTVDACIFWKNPVAQKGGAYSPAVSFGQDIKEQSFGVKLAGLTSPDKLTNNSIIVGSSESANVSPQNGSWKFAYKDDENNHFVAQIMAYFWLTYQENQMLARTGVFYAKNKKIPVDAFNTTVNNNAYWNTERIVMGLVNRNGGQHEMALSAEVYLHEMGHANFQFASGQILQDNNASPDGNSCLTVNGCLGAINEGQADFHFAMLFYENTALGETFMNSLNGISQGGISRDVRKLSAMKASEFFQKSGGEIHGTGSFYASVLWEIYNSSGMKKQDFEKIFMGHLQKLTGSSRFSEGRDALIAEDLVQFNGKYKSIIESVFKNKGLP